MAKDSLAARLTLAAAQIDAVARNVQVRHDIDAAHMAALLKAVGEEILSNAVAIRAALSRIPPLFEVSMTACGECGQHVDCEKLQAYACDRTGKCPMGLA